MVIVTKYSVGKINCHYSCSLKNVNTCGAWNNAVHVFYEISKSEKLNALENFEYWKIDEECVRNF